MGEREERARLGERQSPRDELLGLPFDLYERYALTRRLLPLLWEGRRRLRILDVGGLTSPLKQFVHEHAVFLADPEPPASHTPMALAFDGYVRASGTALPFADSSFDLVTAHDTLEHVPPQDRSRFIREAVRVSRGFVVLNQPVHHPDVEEAERRLMGYLRRVRTEDSPFLREHAELGLPTTEDIEAALRETGVPFVDIPNGNVALWLAVSVAKNYILALPDGAAAAEEIDRSFNSLLAHGDHAAPCYRRAYVIAAGSTGAPRLAPAAASLLAEARPAAQGIGALASLVASLGEHGAAVRELLRSYHEMSTSLRRDVLERDQLIETQRATLEDREAILVGKAEQVMEKDIAIARRDQAIAQRDRIISQYERSTAGRLVRALTRALNRAAPYGTRRRGVVSVVRQGLGVLAQRGFLGFLRWLVSVWRWVPALFRAPLAAPRLPTPADLDPGERPDPYQVWLGRNALTPDRVRELGEELARLEYRPTISVIMPVFNTDPRLLGEAIDSVRAQIYDRWELCIADDGSTERATRAMLRRYRRGDRRIKVVFLKQNRGIVAASNAALSKARGEFCALLDHDDILQPDALARVVRLLNEQPDLEYLYTDEDKMEVDGRRLDPFFKPGWSPDLLNSVNYCTHFSVYRKDLLDRVGRFRPGLDGAQDYDLILRATEATDRIGHVPWPVYSWRKAPGSVTHSEDAKPYAFEAARQALREAAERRGFEAEVGVGMIRGYYRVRYLIQGTPKVQIVIPTRDRVELLRRCIDSVRTRSTYSNYEILVMDNDSKDPATLEYLERFGGRAVRHPGPFNYSRIINAAAEHSRGDYLLFLNNDTEVLSPDWIEALLEHGQRPEVAVVGARLLYPDGKPQHEGIIVGSGDGLAGQVSSVRYFQLGIVVKNCSAVTGACMLTPAATFAELGGFEEQLGVAYQDVDYGLRALEKGYLVVYTPYATLFHELGGTRGTKSPSGGRPHPKEDEDFFRHRWEGFRDPYYNPNFDVDYPYELIPPHLLNAS
jgi:glycosyltransferase involved in cell wall biosynthesis